MLSAASSALGAFSTTAGAQQPLSTASLAPPTGLAAANGTCVRNGSITVTLNWTATSSAYADGYEFLRATTSGGPYAPVGTVSGSGIVSFTDTSTAFATTYYYVVRSTKNAWRSASTPEAPVTTMSKICK